MSEKRYLRTRLKAIIAVCSPTGKLALGSPTQWSGTAKTKFTYDYYCNIRALYQYFANIYSKKSKRTKTMKKPTK